jgi:benzoyl-CoA reductase subunit C
VKEMNVLEKIHDIIKSPHQYPQDWKSKMGGKVIGVLCSNIPEELIYAAGILPVRLLGANEPENITRSYIFQSGFCSFARDCFAQALQGRYKYIDGILFSQCCPHAREVFLDWKRHVSVNYTYEITGPMSVQNRYAKGYLAQELEEFQKSLEKWIGKQIDEKAIDKSIEIYNTNRRLMAQIYGTLKADTSSLSEVAVAEIALAGMLIDRREHNLLLEEVLKQTRERTGPARTGPRLMLLGSVNNNMELIRFIDSLGGRVVVDDYCTGFRYYQTEVVPEENRLESIAGRLINKPPCPLHDLPERRRISYYAQLIEDFKVAGVIYTMQRQCDAHGLDYPAIETFFKTKRIPMLKLELDYTVPVGQFRTRIEGFLEMLTAT